MLPKRAPESGIRDQPGWMVLAQDPSQGYSQIVNQGFSHLKTQPRLKNKTSEFTQVLVSKLPFFAGYWPKGPILHHIVLSTGCLSVLTIYQLASLRTSDYTHTYTHSQAHTQNQDRSSSFEFPNLEMIHPSLLPYSVDHTSSGTIQEEITQK